MLALYDPGIERLTKRESEILLRLAEGDEDSEIAVRLGVMTCTVKHTVVRLYDKLGVRNRAGAVAVAFRQGLVS